MIRPARGVFDKESVSSRFRNSNTGAQAQDIVAPE
jgi:hypothetical protein